MQRRSWSNGTTPTWWKSATEIDIDAGDSHRAVSSGLPPTAVPPVTVRFVSRRAAQHAVAVLATRVHRPFQADVPVGEGAGLVGEQHVDVAEVLDAHQALHENLPLGETPRAGGEARRHDRGRSCGVIPTATANENSTASISGRPSSRFTTRIVTLSTTPTRRAARRTG